MGKKLWFSVTALQLLAVAGVSCAGLFTTGFYHRETPNWQVQSIGQDLFDLVVIVPVLFISSIMVFRNKRGWIAIWAGAELFLLYTFVIYAFAVHFNELFLAYCFILGLSFYLFLYFFTDQFRRPIMIPQHTPLIFRIAGGYLITVAVLFYGLWLTDVLPASFSGETTSGLMDTGLITNPVHVLDLSVFLPGMAFSGWWLWKGRSAGLWMSTTILFFTVLMNLNIGLLMVLMAWKGLVANGQMAYVMGGLAAISFVLLMLLLRQPVNVPFTERRIT